MSQILHIVDNPKLIEIIIDRRKKLGMPQSQLPEISQISRTAIIEFELGNTSIRLRRLSRILSALDMTPSIKPGASQLAKSELREFFKDEDE